MPFLMIRNDITKVAADAIVNPANRNLLQGSGTSRAIYQAAGEQELTAACEAIGHCDLGRAVCTPAFGLPAKYIFHTVCPAWHGGFFGEAKQLVGAYYSALELAAKYHCESVAFPLLSSGNYGYPKEQAFRIAVDTITQYIMEHDLTVYLVLYDRHSLTVSRCTVICAAALLRAGAFPQRQALVKTPGAIRPGCQCRRRRSFRTAAQKFLPYAAVYSCRRLRSDLHGQHPRQPRRYPY